MSDARRYQELIQTQQFTALFIDLGWDNPTGPKFEEVLGGESFLLVPVAEKRGVKVYSCVSLSSNSMPRSHSRRLIENRVHRREAEHLIIFTDKVSSTQIWQWTRREQGKPPRIREIIHYSNQSGERLMQSLASIRFALDEEEELTLFDVLTRTQAAFDKERTTKGFFDRFMKERKYLLEKIEGIESEGHREWYGTLMLNRLMFIYFIQRKGLLDENPNYLTAKLDEVKDVLGPERFHSFYRSFLRVLFKEGLSKPETLRTNLEKQLLGNVPYLNGGIFDEHEIERDNDLHIPDGVFERILVFFNGYTWHLDDRPTGTDREINPEILGYILEKLVNQKEMGAYYTPEDITEYIGRNTILPALIDRAALIFPESLGLRGSSWNALRQVPRDYLFEATTHGLDEPLPVDVQAGIKNVGERSKWNERSNSRVGFPTESWRDAITRLEHTRAVLAAIEQGEVASIDDFTTFNLDVRRYINDVIEQGDARTVEAIYVSATSLSVLDPTCGSGAFLFAALQILQPIYEACLARMERLLASEEEGGTQRKARFQSILAVAATHANRTYFIIKSVILNNLFGIDIEDQAVEICKLRLFLKLAAQLDDGSIPEPLPDIDFNIRSGNALIGFVNQQDVDIAVRGKMQLSLDLDQIESRISENARKIMLAGDRFRVLQQGGQAVASEIREAKSELLGRLDTQRKELDEYLARNQGVEGYGSAIYRSWHDATKPFHWYLEFFSIIDRGGFDVTMGNPPYVEISKIKDFPLKAYRTESSGNLYAPVIERSLSCAHRSGRLGMIVQLPFVCTASMQSARDVIEECTQFAWFSTYDDRPSKLFKGLEHIRASIILLKLQDAENTSTFQFRTTKYHRWKAEARAELFQLTRYSKPNHWRLHGTFPKVSTQIELEIAQKLLANTLLGDVLMNRATHSTCYYHNAPQYFIRATDFIPHFWNERDGEKMSSHIKPLNFAASNHALAAIAALNSNTFYWWFVALSDCRDLTKREILTFPLGLDSLSNNHFKELETLVEHLMQDYRSNSFRKRANYKTTGMVEYDEFYPKRSKHILDAIDRVLGAHWGFTEEELDWIINFDFSARMGDRDDAV